MHPHGTLDTRAVLPSCSPLRSLLFERCYRFITFSKASHEWGFYQRCITNDLYILFYNKMYLKSGSLKTTKSDWGLLPSIRDRANFCSAHSAGQASSDRIYPCASIRSHRGICLYWFIFLYIKLNIIRLKPFTVPLLRDIHCWPQLFTKSHHAWCVL